MPDTQMLLNAIDAQASMSYGSDNDNGELARQRALALDSFQGKNIEPATKGTSQVVDWTIFETAQFILPSLTRIFAAGDDVVEFEPVGKEDEDVAKQESQVLNHLVTQKNNWFLTCLVWFQDALITKNAYCMAEMEEKLITETERYESQSEEQVTLLLEDDLEITGQEQRDDPNDPGLLIDPANGQPIDPNDQETTVGAMALYALSGQEPERQFKQIFDVEVRRVEPKKQLRFTVLPPENCRISQDTPDFTLNDCPYFEYFTDITLSDLRKLGYDVDDDIASRDSSFDDSLESNARDEILGTERSDTDNPVDPSMRMVRARTVWIQFDYDEDGIAELQKVVVVADKILEKNGEPVIESASRIPVASLVPFINTHRHIGISVADLTFDIQRIKTKFLRSGLNSLDLATNPRHAASKKVNLDDLLVSRSGAIVQVDTQLPDVAGHVVPLQTQNTFPDAQQGLAYMDTVVESRVGVTKQFQGIDASANNDHDRIGQLSSMAAQRVEQIARIFGNGVENLFSIAHELVIKSGHQMEAIKLRGEWVDIDPTQWRTGRDMRVVAPFAAGNKDSLLNRLMILRGIHSEAAAAGHPMVQQDDSYELALEISKAADLMGTKYFTDPATVEPPPPPPDHTETALQIENKKVDNEADDEARQSEFDVNKLASDEAIKKYGIDVNAQTTITVAQINAGKTLDAERLKADLRDEPIKLGNDAIKATGDAVTNLQGRLEDSIDKLSDAVKETKKLATAPIKIVRENGKIIGKEVAGQFVPLEDG